MQVATVKAYPHKNTCTHTYTHIHSFTLFEHIQNDFSQQKSNTNDWISLKKWNFPNSKQIWAWIYQKESKMHIKKQILTYTIRMEFSMIFHYRTFSYTFTVFFYLNQTRMVRCKYSNPLIENNYNLRKFGNCISFQTIFYFFLFWTLHSFDIHKRNFRG